MFFCEFCEVFRNAYFVACLRRAASEPVRCYVYILLSEVRLEEEKEYKNYLRITPEYFDELFVLMKDGMTKEITNMRDASPPKLNLAGKIFQVHSCVDLFS